MMMVVVLLVLMMIQMVFGVQQINQREVEDESLVEDFILLNIMMKTFQWSFLIDRAQHPRILSYFKISQAWEDPSKSWVKRRIDNQYIL